MLFFAAGNATSQNVVNNGASIVVRDGAYFVIGGSYYNKNDGAFDGRINLDGKIILKHNWINYANNEVMTSAGIGTVGSVIMDGSAKQYIEGTHSSLFENLVLKDSKKILGISNCKVNDTVFLDAVLDLDRHRIKLLNSKPTAIQHLSKYIVSETNSFEGLGELEWYIGQDTDTYVVPFGSGYSDSSDLAINLDIRSAGFPSSGSVTFATYPTGCQNVPIPSTVNLLDRSFEYIADRFWIIDPDYDEKPRVDMILKYRQEEIDQSCNYGLIEDEMKAIRYNTVMHTWIDMAPRGYSAPDQNRFFIEDVAPADFYAPWCLVEEIVDWTIFFPTSFTPNIDGLNETFGPIGLNLEKLQFKMYIYNRWGGLVYVMDDMNKPWNGRAMNSDHVCPEGVYVWRLSLKDKDGLEHNYKGNVTLIL